MRTDLGIFLIWLSIACGYVYVIIFGLRSSFWNQKFARIKFFRNLSNPMFFALACPLLFWGTVLAPYQSLTTLFGILMVIFWLIWFYKMVPEKIFKGIREFFLRIFVLIAMSFSLAIPIFLFSLLMIEWKVHTVVELCQSPVDTSIETVLQNAKNLGFEAKKWWALPYGISIQKNIDDRMSLFQSNTIQLDEGLLKFGRVSFPPFGRHYCRINFMNRKVTETKVSIID